MESSKLVTFKKKFKKLNKSDIELDLEKELSID